MNRRSRWIVGLILSPVLLEALSAGHAGDKIPIEVQVEVTEVDNSRASSLGVDWVNSFRLAEETIADIVSVGSLGRMTHVQADLHYLVEEGAAELLANPNLVTDSGTTATFHAGGEIPYITNSSLGATHVEFKTYGVRLDISPKVLTTGSIQMKIRASVSAPDQTNGVLLSGNLVPALFEREVTSHVTVDPGSTITLAGLVQTQKEERTRGVPLLKEIPLLGSLFRWRKVNQRRTTIIMFVTPRLVEI